MGTTTTSMRESGNGVLKEQKEQLEELLDTQISFAVKEDRKYHDDILIEVRDTNRDELVGSWKLVEFPGCCGIVIATGAYVNRRYRNRGLNQFMNRVRQEIARRSSYSLMVATTQADEGNTRRPENVTVLKNGFSLLMKFLNTKTENKLSLWAKDLTEKDI